MDITLYPPQVDTKLPAFYASSNGKIILRVPFHLNRAHAREEFNGMAIILKTVTTGAVKYQHTANNGDIHYDKNTKSYYVEYDLTSVSQLPPEDKNFFAPVVGQYYKLQIAFAKDDYIGYYSSMTVVKYTSRPSKFEISGLKPDQNNVHSYTYSGVYSQEGRDTTERVYSYRFDVKTSEGTLVDSSGDILHNSNLDKHTYESQDTWTVTKTLERNTQYLIQYTVTTLNGCEFQTQNYYIIAGETIDIQAPIQLKAEMNNDDGCAILSLIPNRNEAPKAISGNFVLLRASSEDDYGNWTEICHFELAQQYIDDLKIWEDFTLKHGYKYIYAIQAYNSKGLFTNRLLNVVEGRKYVSANYSEYSYKHIELLADFEDAYLFDGKRQLRIRYNPKISSFKSTILESKTDTIGGRYPFIFRNGNVQYKEFPISGLISLNSDPNERFMKGIQNKYKDTSRREILSDETDYEFDTQLTSRNIQREREFKMEVLKWLTNGEPKLFRSPGEGNYIVRLMNTSLSPNDQLGRMLHTFSCTAYEIAEYNFENLNKFNFIQSTAIETKTLKIAQLQLNDLEDGIYENGVEVKNSTVYLPDAYIVSITEAIPGTTVGWNFSDGTGEVSVEIGVTGAYYIEIEDRPVTSITLEKGTFEGAKLTYGYYETQIPDNFTYVADIKLSDEIAQYFGRGLVEKTDNLIDLMEDIRKETGKFHYIRIRLRDHTNLWYINGGYSRNEIGTDPLPPSEWFSGTIYYVKNQNKWYDGSISKPISKPEYIFRLNGSTVVDFSRYRTDEPITQGRYEALTNIDKVDMLVAGTGLVIDVVYQLRTIEYTVETTVPSVKLAKEEWEAAVKTHETNPDGQSLATMNQKYAVYIRELTAALNEQKGAYEVVYAV